jgi:hypothetical protein
MSKATKSNKSAASVVVVAMLAAIESMKTLPAAPAFNGDDIRKVLEASALPADFITKAVAESQRKHEASHGDTQGKELAALFDSLLNIEGMEVETLIRAAKASAGEGGSEGGAPQGCPAFRLGSQVQRLRGHYCRARCWH